MVVVHEPCKICVSWRRNHAGYAVIKPGASSREPWSKPASVRGLFSLMRRLGTYFKEKPPSYREPFAMLKKDPASGEDFVAGILDGYVVLDETGSCSFDYKTDHCQGS